MDAPAREEELKTRTAEQREVLLARLVEYAALSKSEREMRLRATDLYWHLQQLLHRAPAERSQLLASAPEDLRGILAERLALWDSLPIKDREALLQHERAIRYFARLRAAPHPPLPGSHQPAARLPNVRIPEELERYQRLSSAERAEVHRQWAQFFEAPPPGKNRTLRAMSDVERREMQTVLERMRGLPPAQRQVCIDSFARFAGMSTPERAAFLRSVEMWEALTPEERATWRHLVTMLPQLPPANPAMLPYLPSDARNAARSARSSTGTADVSHPSGR
jgi:hypothetical protein